MYFLSVSPNPPWYVGYEYVFSITVLVQDFVGIRLFHAAATKT